MASDPPAPGRRRGTTVWAILNVLAAIAWGGIGMLGMGLALGLSVHPSDALAPLVLVGGAVWWGVSGGLLFSPGPDGRPRRWAVLAAFLAGACGLGYSALCWALGLGDLRELDPGTVGHRPRGHGAVRASRGRIPVAGGVYMEAGRTRRCSRPGRNQALAWG
jgi:hypothetical protein